MIDPRRLIAGAAALAILGTAPLVAHAQDEHAGHHPADTPASEAGPSPSPPAADKPNAMMGGAGEMSGRQGMMGQMGERGMPMMCMGGGGMAMADDLEGRISFLRTELKITDAQSRPWKSFADVLRANATKMGKLHDAMMTEHKGGTPLSPMQRLDLHDRMLTTAHDNIRALRPALARLYAGLSAEQKRKADSLLAPHPGMMLPMPMSGMMTK